MNPERNLITLKKSNLIKAAAVAAGVTTICAPLVVREVLRKKGERQGLEEREQLAGDGCFPFTKESIIFNHS